MTYKIATFPAFAEDGMPNRFVCEVCSQEFYAQASFIVRADYPVTGGAVLDDSTEHCRHCMGEAFPMVRQPAVGRYESLEPLAQQT